MAKKIREFMTHRDPDEQIWVERDESAVIGTARMGQRLVPKIRPFDLLRSTPRSGNRGQVMVWEGDTLQIAVENLLGLEEQLTRAADHDLVYFQFCGRSTIESECGVVEMEPGEFVLVPAAISHRSSGRDECLRVRIATRELVNLGVDPEKPLAETKFKVRPSEPFRPQGNGRQALAESYGVGSDGVGCRPDCDDPSRHAHRITGSPGFLRMVFYSRGLVHPKAFNNISERETSFEVQ
jgi:hypothetical protein